jgi:uncharacterized protein
MRQTMASKASRYLLAAPSVLLLLVLIATRGAHAETLLQNFPQSQLQIATPDARLHRFNIWVADTDPRRERGLMFVKDLPDDAGMLFIYPAPRVISLWMKNTFIPLDMVFIGGNGRITQIVANATPQSLDIIASKDPALAILELKGGIAAKLGLRPGAIVSSPALKTQP